MSDFVEFLQQTDGRQVLASAVFVGNPLAFFAAVVEVEHRRDRIDAQAIDVVLVQPEQGVGDQEVAHFVAAVVEDHGSPVRMLALTRIFMFEQSRAVEASQPVAVFGEVGRHPVQDHADAVAMAVVDKVHEVFRRPVTAGDRKVADRLIAPTAGKGMFADRHQFQVGVSHLLAVVDQLACQFAIVQPAVLMVTAATPTAQDALRRSRSAGSAGSSMRRCSIQS